MLNKLFFILEPDEKSNLDKQPTFFMEKLPDLDITEPHYEFPRFSLSINQKSGIGIQSGEDYWCELIKNDGKGYKSNKWSSSSSFNVIPSTIILVFASVFVLFKSIILDQF